MSSFLTQLTQDTRYAVRGLLRRPGFTLLGIATLALGIGAVVAMWSAVDAVLLEPLPYADPDRLVVVWQDHQQVEGPRDEWVSADNFFVWREQSRLLDGMFLIGGTAPTLQGSAGILPERLQGAAVSHGALESLGVTPELGRTFSEEENRAGGERVALLGHALWTRRFEADPAVVGAKISLDGMPTTVVGVAPAGFEVPFVGAVDIVLPAAVDSTNSCGHGCVTFRSVARLAPGASLEAAQGEMDAIQAQLAQDFAANRDIGIWLEPLGMRATAPYRTGLWVLLGAVAAVLLIACTNVANLTLARLAGRDQEIGVRVALGAGRRRVVSQMLCESLVLAAAGALAGLGLAVLGVRLLREMAPASATRFQEISLSGQALGLALGLAVLTGLGAGLAPALRSGARAAAARGGLGAGARLRRALVVVQVALATVLLIGGGLLARSFAELMQVDPGFRTDGLLTQQIFLPPGGYPEMGDVRSFVERLEQSVQRLPGVVEAGVVNSLPLTGADGDQGFLIQGRQRAQGERPPVAWTRLVSSGYLRAAQPPLVAGRLLAASDGAEAPPVALVNEAAARRYWPDGDALGARILLSRSGPEIEVVGILGDARQFGIAEPDRPALYLPFAQQPGRFMSVVLRSEGPPEAQAPHVAAVVAALDPTLAVSGVSTMRELVRQSVSVPRLLRTVLVGFAAVAMLLAAMGIYGIMAFTVRRSQSELGLRMALGASPGQVLGRVLASGAALAGVGLLLGLLVALGSARLLASQLFAVSPYDALTFAGVIATLLAAALLATLLPALRAMRVDPQSALRQE